MDFWFADKIGEYCQGEGQAVRGIPECFSREVEDITCEV